jgi:hypothetical protein
VIRDLIQDMYALDRELAAAGPALAITRQHLGAAVGAVEAASRHLLEKLASDPNAAAAGCTPFLKMLGLTVGGWLLARGALKAGALLDDGAGDADFLRGRIATARFFNEQLLPQVQGLAPAAMAPADLLYAIPPERLTA